MVKLFEATFSFLIVLVSIEKGLALTCLKCNSTNVDGDCRTGARPKDGTRMRQTCSGATATCFIIVSVGDQGQTYFQRGCSDIDDFCKQSSPNVLLCHSCKFLHCNYNVIAIGNKNEDYEKVQNSQNEKDEIKISEILNQENKSSGIEYNQGKIYKSTNDFRKGNRSSTGINPEGILPEKFTENAAVPTKLDDDPQKNTSNETSNTTDLADSKATQLNSASTKIKEALIGLLNLVAANEQLQKTIEDGTFYGFGEKIKKQN